MRLREFLGRTFHQSYLVVFLCVGILVGMILGLVFRINYFGSPIWLLVVGLVFLYGYIKPEYVFSMILFVAGMILAFFRIATELSGENYIREFYGQTVVVSGSVSGDPETDTKGTKVKLVSLKFGEEVSTSGSLFVTLRENREIRRDDILVLSGKMSEGFGTYAGYMYKPEILEVRRAEPGNLIVSIRDFFAERISSSVDSPQANLGLSYLLGMETGLPENLSESLRVVGLTHIVVASGSHLTILVELAKKLFGRVSRFAGLLFSILFVLFFMVMVGFTPSILRAGVMSILMLVAWYVGRKFEAWRILLIVAAVTLMFNPMFLIDLGWLLSFASLFGIMILMPRWVKFFYGEKKPGFIAETIFSSMTATVMTLPITLYYFGAISLISVAANLLILPTLSFAMGLVFLVGVFVGVPVVEGLASFLATLMLDFHIFVVEFFGSLRSFLVEIPAYQPQVFLIYILVFIPLAVGLIRRKMVKLREVR
ncbi:MAG: ComEC/Rec2 family competence protein [Candidatus Saccharibacteria bacterium]|nr:ComEC/Rec2 family competence protein [Candidatus Saccharibacteria bacterium]